MKMLMDPKNRGGLFAFVGAAVVGLTLMLGEDSNQREITWQEFQAKYLDEGKVGCAYHAVLLASSSSMSHCLSFT
jgi:hypothetical protein